MPEYIVLRRKLEPLKLQGTGRDPNNNRALSLSFNRSLTDDELRFVDDTLQDIIAKVRGEPRRCHHCDQIFQAIHPRCGCVG